MKILLTGASGLLGKELLKINPNIIAATHEAMEITDLGEVLDYIETHEPDVVIHAAAMTDNRLVEKEPYRAVSTNIIGTANVALACMYHNIRLVYLSTDYVYAGERGNFSEQEPLKPFNLYAWSKLGGECSVVGVENHLIIRTSFGGNFQYKQAFTDKYSSKDYVDRLAPQIYEAAVSPLTGVLNLGTERKTLFDHAKERNPDVIPVKLSETNFFTPIDTSLNLQRWINYKSSKSIAKPHTNCRICDSSRLVKYLDLGLMPLANNLAHTAQEAKSQDKFPLQVTMCEDCGLSQLSVVIDPEKMFSNYAYRSSVNKPYVEHCRLMAKDLKREYNLGTESFHVDIAGNDGSLLNEFRAEIGLKVLNVDPASNLVAICEAQGIPAVADFWSLEVAQQIEKKHGRADLITATNVIAHLDGVKEFMVAAKGLLKKSGVLVIECPYLIDFIENMEYPTLYFEHISTMSVRPIAQLAKQKGLKIINVEKFPIHCGTIRITLAHDTSYYVPKPSVSDFTTKEILGGYDKKETYQSWEGKVKAQVHEFEMKLLELKKSGAKIAAFSASAKGNTLLNYAKMNTDIISYIMDETPEKVGKFSPGTGIPIVHKQHLLKDMPDYVIVLAWNFADVLIAKLREMGYTGKFIVPIPSFKIID